MKRIKVLKSKIHGKGIFADEDIKSGEKIQYIHGPKIKKIVKTPKESKIIENWIGVEKHMWIDTGGTPFQYINHSCYPNAAITGTKTLIALEDIKCGTEITIDYSMTDADPFWHITCSCGADGCRKEIRAIYAVPTEVFKRHFKYVAKPFQRIFINSYIQAKTKNSTQKS